MRKLNKKGFTLIELLVTIALMLSILGIAIVSFITISNNRKKQAWDLVKGQIETAAKEYFTSNEYLFEGLTGKISGTISVGKLVSQDFINIVTDPRSGKTIDTCSLVEIKKENKNITATYIGVDSSRKCDSDNSYSLSEQGAPIIKSIDIKKLDGKNDPYNKWYQDGAKFILNYETGGNGNITNILSCKTTTSDFCEAGENSDAKVNYNLEKDNTNDPTATVCFIIQNSSGKKASQCKSASIDNKPPTCKITASPTSWTNKDVKVNITCNDTASGCIKQNSKTISEESKTDAGTTVNLTSKDNVGHETKCPSVKVYIDKTAPTIEGLTIKSTENDYNTRKANVSWSSSDILSGIDYVESNKKEDTTNKTQWFKKGAKECSKDECKFLAVIADKYQKKSNSYNGENNVEITAVDIAGNSRTLSKTYKVYNYCEQTTTTTTNGNWSNCTKTCGGGTQTRTITKNVKDKHNNKIECSGNGSTEKETQSCNTKACPTTTTTENVCAGLNKATTDTIKNFINVTSSVTNLSGSNVIVGSGTSTKGTKATFTFTANKTGVKIHTDIAGAFCKDSDTCENITNHEGWNTSGTDTKVTKNTWCASGYGCKGSNYKYITACARVTCGNTDKIVCYRRTTTSAGEFSKVRNN